MEDASLTFSAALRARLRRAGFAYAALMLFYVLDISSTVAVLSSGKFVEGNPINRGVLDSAGTLEWVVFRLATFAGVTVLVSVAFALTATVLARKEPGKRPVVDLLEDGVVGTTIVFYALALFHNLATVAPALAGAT